MTVHIITDDKFVLAAGNFVVGVISVLVETYRSAINLVSRAAR